MGLNKLLTFAQSSTNILSDSEYQTDSERASGNILSSIARSKLINKVLKQTAAVANAIGSIIANNTSLDATDTDASNLALGITLALKKLYVATFSYTSDNIWNFTISDLPTSGVSDYAVIVNINTSSVDNQKVVINSGSQMSIYVSNTSPMMSADVVGTQDNPYPVVFTVSNGKVYYAKSVSASQITSWTNHVNNKNNPHEVTIQQIGAAAAFHVHSAADITSGILPLARGGTNGADAATARTNLGVPPTSHASSAITYGIGTTDNYGHVKVTAGNGLSISSGAIAMGAASASAAGAMTTGAQTIAGTKTFSGVVIVGNPAINTAAARRIYAGTGGLTSGSSALTTGTIYFQYE